MVKERTPFPQALAHLKGKPGWLIWRWVKTNTGKLTKPPFQPRFPERKASNKNPRHWSDFTTAIAAKRADRADGVGFVVSASREEVWIDLDDCRHKDTGTLADWAERIVTRANSYTEITPSGEGVRIVGRFTTRLADKPIHKPYKMSGGAKGEIFYRATRYVTITGQRYEGTPDDLNPLDEIVSLILREAVSIKDGEGVNEGTDTIPVPGDDDPVLDIDTRPALNLSLEQIKRYLAALPPAEAKDEAGNGWWDRDKWLQVIFAVHDDTDGSEDGYSLVDEWCASTPHYDPEGLRERWESARGSNVGESRTSIRTVIKWAKDWTKPQREDRFEKLLARMARGQNRSELEDCAEDARSLQVDTATARAELRSQYRIAFKRITGMSLGEGTATKEIAYRDPDIATMPRWLRSFVWVTNIKRFYDAHTGLLYDLQNFDVTFGSRFMSPEELAQGADIPSVSPSQTAINRYKVPVAAALGYKPEKDRVEGDDELDDEAGGDGEGPSRIRKPRLYSLNGIRYVNRFHTRGAVPSKHGPWTEQEKKDIRTILKLYRRVCGTERDTGIVLTFIHKTVILRQRVSFCIILCSAEGTGKTTAIFTIPSRLIGQENVGVYQPNVLMDKTDGSWMDGHLLKVIEELWVPSYAKAAVIERMKPMITNDMVSPRFMFEGTRNVINTASYIGLTNHPDVLALTIKDTRFFLVQPEGIQTKAQVDRLLTHDPKFYAEVHEAIERSLPAFKGWLETKFEPHPAFLAANGRAPDSETKQQVIEEMRDPLDRDILDLLDQAPHPLVTRDVICLRTLHKTLVMRGIQIAEGGEKGRLEKLLSHALRRLDFQARGQFRLGTLVAADPDSLDEGPPDNRTRIYTSGVGPLDQGKLSPERLEAWIASDGL
ncbi:PriCT-2 domain-containing protein [Falsiroseomonas sp. E2-1-a4]|uniref:PriCT-2 domain-containing protein n=1 Tax=Falsiroseomonas sp. E2-1-a4 TaxID=3239299 RepID=UPI003F3D2D4D